MTVAHYPKYVIFKGVLLGKHLWLLNPYRVVNLEASSIKPAAELPFQ